MTLAQFIQGLGVKFHQNEPLEATFSLTGIDASIANAFRRILLAEVPTLAIEKVYVHNNTSVVADEVLSHRLGLIPLRGSPSGLRWLKWVNFSRESEPSAEKAELTDYNTIVIDLKVRCEAREGVDLRTETDASKKYINSNVYAKHLKFKPMGQQVMRFEDGPIEPANPDILIAKLRPGQEINVQLFAHKGNGMDHAKFSPVATATYRLLPTITIKEPITGPDATKFQACFPPGVIDLERVTPTDAASGIKGYEGKEGDEKAVVKDTFRDTVSRECLRHDEFKDKVKLGRVQDHFIFNIESTGQFQSDALFLDSVVLLKYKGLRLLRALDDLDKV
jgi:DNA-directed RNA polymerase I and III subunit RPAC1